MSKQSATQARVNSPGLTRSASVLDRRNSLGKHVAVQRAPANRDSVQPAAEDLVRDVLRSPGRALDPNTRASAENQLGYDFSRVRVHTNSRAAESARAVNAKAYTAGRHVVFGDGSYAPGSPIGQRLLTHELTHVVQQASEPVFGTQVTKGLAISHPGDRFERSARETSVRPEAPQRPKNGMPKSLPASAASDKPIVLQRQDTSPPGPYMQQQTQAAQQSAAAGEKSANIAKSSLIGSSITGGLQALGGLVSAFEAIRQANFAERQAQAAEDPPVAEPTTGGVNSTHIEVPEVKGVKETKETHTEDEDLTTTTGPTKAVVEETTEGQSTATSTETTPQPQKGPKTTTTTTRMKGTEKKTSETPEHETKSHGKKTVTVVKDADDADKETEPFTVLRLIEGKTKSQADFMFTLRYNDTDVRGGATEDGEINGYLGGTNNSNAAVTFRASPGKHIEGGVATVRLLFGGTNVPPRKTVGASLGFFSLAKGGTETAKDYAVQRFSGSAIFSGKGEMIGVNKPKVTPADRSTVSTGDGRQAPLVTIGLNVSESPATKAPAAAPAPAPTPQAAPASPPVSPGGPK